MEKNSDSRINLFWQISQSLVSKEYLEEILHLIVTMTAEVMGSKICSLMLLDESRQELSIAATQALSIDYRNKPNVRVDGSVSGRAVKERQPVMVADVTKEKNYRYPEIAMKAGIVSMVSIPMMISNRPIGVINSYTTQPYRFSEVEIKILQAVANQAAVAIENTKLRRENAEAKEALVERKLVERAKALIMEKHHIKEAEAYRLLQKTSRDNRKSMADVANAILLAYQIKQ